MLPTILENNDEEKRVENNNRKKLQAKQKNNYEETRVKNEIKIPKLPSLQKILKQYINHIFDEDKKLSIENLLQGTTKTTWQQVLDNELGRLEN